MWNKHGTEGGSQRPARSGERTSIRDMKSTTSLRYYREWEKKMGITKNCISKRKDRVIKIYQSGSVQTREKVGRTEDEKKMHELWSNRRHRTSDQAL